ncbi:MAG: hydrogenase 3 maturation endopeptidase HyCI [Thermoplasmata archaeon]|nr:hydrogenase 3 maturation endopeptidase HyCI [Thermoplasmata archaeon]
MVSVLMGVGNPLKGDDGVGPYAADYMASLSPRGWEAWNVETVPENYTGRLRRVRPETLVVVDACDMGLEAGEARRIPPEMVGVMHVSTHSIPLSVFLSIVKEYVGDAVLVGVQADMGNMFLGAELTPRMQAAARRLVETLVSEGPGGVAVLQTSPSR